MAVELVPLEAHVEVDYTVDDPMIEMSASGKHYPITINEVKLRGQTIDHLLTIHHVMLIQRRLYFRIIEDQE